MTVPADYLRDPAEIYRASFAAIDAAAPIGDLPAPIRPVARRLVHATGNPDLLENLVWSDGAADATASALKTGAPVLVDADMVAAGIVRDRLPASNDVICTLRLSGVAGAAQRLGTTRSAAAVDYWQPWLEGAVVAFGNAPTALFHLLERLAEGWPKPAVVLGFPVGFIGAAESKDALIDADVVPYITLRGRLGGSAMAAAAVNALAGESP